MVHSIILASLLSQALASILPRNVNQYSSIQDHINDVCWPKGVDGSIRADAPCWQALQIDLACTDVLDLKPLPNDRVRIDNLEYWDDPYRSNPINSWLSPVDQRNCICQSQWWDRQLGCEACYAAHGVSNGWDSANRTVWNSVSSSYCAATNTPTLPFGSALRAAFPTEIVSYAITHTQTTITDPASSQTAESLYWTDGLSNAAAYSQAMPTGTSVNTVSGQIVQTASPTITPSFKPASMSTGAAPALGLHAPAAAVGALGIAVALL